MIAISDDAQRAGIPIAACRATDGDTYLRHVAFVEELPTEPDLVIVSTFKRIHENTHIEPSLRNGMRYVDMTGSSLHASVETARRCRMTTPAPARSCSSNMISCPMRTRSSACAFSGTWRRADVFLTIDIYDLDHPVHPEGHVGWCASRSKRWSIARQAGCIMREAGIDVSLAGLASEDRGSTKHACVRAVARSMPVLRSKSANSIVSRAQIPAFADAKDRSEFRSAFRP